MHRFIKIFGFSLLLLSTQVIAICSQYMGSATLNEAGKVGFIEIKLLDGAIASGVYNTWSVQACESQHGSCSGALSLSTGTLSNAVYIVVPTNFIPSNKPFDILLLDDMGNTIDYLSVDYTHQQDNSCSLTYDWTAPHSSSHTYRRMPDGTGDWGDTGSGNSGGDTGGGPNEGYFGLIAEWRFEETSWTGASGEVLDSSGNSLNGTTFLAASTGDSSPDPAIIGDPGTCRYGDFNYSGVQVDDNDLLDMSNSFTLSAWIRHQTSFSNLVEDIIISKGYNFLFSLNYRLSVQTDGDLRLTWNGGSLDSSTNIPNDGSWVHVAASYENGEQILYINGVADASSAATDTLLPNAYALSLGGLSSLFWGWGFVGQIDEVKIYDYALSASEVTTVYNETHPCATSTNLFQISHDGAGLTCAPEPILIRACSNASCSSFDNTVNTTVTMQVNSGADQTINIVNGSSANETFSYTDINTPAVLSLTSDNLCSDTSDSSTGCAVDFTEAGFLLNLDNHLSCTTSSLKIQAVKLSDSGLDCVPAYTGDQSVDFVFNYSNPTIGTEVPSLDTVDMASASVIQNKIVNFDGTGTANLDFIYQDAGEIRIDISDAASAGLTSSSVTAIVTPAKLIVASPDTDANCVSGDGSDINCTAFKVAGANFNLNISAACSDDTITKNFEMNNIPLTVTTIAPNLGNLVSLGVTSVDVVEADDGSHNESNQTVSEVGVFTITATPPVMGYLGETIPAATSANIGRFYPAYFIQTIDAGNDEGSLTANHGLTCSTLDWAYSGQLTELEGSIRYSIEPTLTITAYNGADPSSVTKNYTGAFAKLVNLVTDTDNEISFLQPSTMHTNALPLSGDVSGIGTIMAQGDGVLTYQLPDAHHFVYTRTSASEIAPFKADFELPFDVFKDSDEVTFKPTDSIDYFENPKFYQVDAVPPALAFDNTIDIRFGRWRMENSFAPETSALSMTMLIEHFNGTEFITNPEENCIIPEIVTKHETGAIGSGGLTLWDYRLFDADNTDDLGTSHTDASVDGSVYDSGVYRKLFFSAPFSTVENRQGPLKVEYQVPAWLQYDWTGDGNFTNNPSATLTFGIFRGNDRIIYQREIQQ